MRLFEAILEANHRVVAGDNRAGLQRSEYADSLPVVALTCIDPRLNRLFPDAMGVSADEFIWLRNAGNIIFDPLSSMMRTLALACAVKGGKEIAVIGHSDCRVRQTTVNQLIESFRALGIHRSALPDNLVEFFGLFASERQNVINGTTHIRRSPLISPRVPVHGLMIDVDSGRLEWVVNGYEQMGTAVSSSPIQQKLEQAKEIIGAVAAIRSGEMTLREVKIGDLTIDPRKWMSEVQSVKQKIQEVLPGGPPPAKPPVPPPPPIRPGKK